MPRSSARQSTSTLSSVGIRRSARRGNVALPVEDSSVDTTPLLRTARERKPRINYSPSAQAETTKRPARRHPDSHESSLSSSVTDTELTPDELCRRLEGRVRSYVKQLRYLQTFLEAYEAEGWRRASREKLKPSKELAVARHKLVKTKRHVVNTLHEMDALRQNDPPNPYLIELAFQPVNKHVGETTQEDEDAQADRIYCSRCQSTITAEDNDILLCDAEGCFRAFHQQCQVPTIRTDEIPQGDEPWFCASCLAIFNALKAINYTFDTRHEHIGDVFPDLVQEEQSLLANGEDDVSTAEGTAEEDTADDAEYDDDDDDEDFVVDETQLKVAEDQTDELSDSAEDSDDTSADDGVLESDVGEDELVHLHNDDVIDTNRRSLRSHKNSNAKQSSSNTNSYLGERVAKENEGDNVVFGVVVEKDNIKETVAPWRVVYFDDTMGYLDNQAVVQAMELANVHEKVADDSSQRHEDEVDQSLILRGKRKRSRVDYRALNDLMFAGQEDSDPGVDSESEADEAAANDEEEEDFQPTTTSVKPTVPTESIKRGRRLRAPVDYRAMHEGL